MDPYVLALQLYLINKACGGLPLRIAEQVVVAGVINATCWTARTIGSGVIWMVRPNTQTTQIQTSRTVGIESLSQSLGTDLLSEFEIITPEQLKELPRT